MKWSKHGLILLYLPSFLLILLLTTACAQPEHPSEKELQDAVVRALGSNIPVSWVGNLMGGKNAKVEEIQVVRIGIYNQEKKYWPIKIRCIGHCQLNDPFNQDKYVSFDKVGDFILYRDDYGDWQAVLKGGMFQ